jgi:hypothetical protein
MPECSPGVLQERICTVEGCTEFIRCKGFCNAHYQRHLKGLAMEAKKLIPRDGPCFIEGCRRPRSRSGLCSSHYDQARRRATCPGCGGTKKEGSALCLSCHRGLVAASSPTEKTCGHCGRILPVYEFNHRKSGDSVKLRSECKECQAADQRMRAKNVYHERLKNSPYRPYQALRLYARRLGIPWTEVADRYPPDNRCEICGRTPEETVPDGKVRRLRLGLDHCHKTGTLRGFLCNACNIAIGYFGDDPARLIAGAQYLLRNTKGSTPPAGS